MNRFDKLYCDYIKKPTLTFENKEIDLCIKRDDFLDLLVYGKILEKDLSELQDRVDFLIDRNDKKQEVLDKIKEKLEKYNDKETNMYAPIQECLDLLEELK